jgi:hypothetical protein
VTDSEVNRCSSCAISASVACRRLTRGHSLSGATDRAATVVL